MSRNNLGCHEWLACQLHFCFKISMPFSIIDHNNMAHALLFNSSIGTKSALLMQHWFSFQWRWRHSSIVVFEGLTEAKSNQQGNTSIRQSWHDDRRVPCQQEKTGKCLVWIQADFMFINGFSRLSKPTESLTKNRSYQWKYFLVLHLNVIWSRSSKMQPPFQVLRHLVIVIQCNKLQLYAPRMFGHRYLLYIKQRFHRLSLLCWCCVFFGIVSLAGGVHGAVKSIKPHRRKTASSWRRHSLKIPKKRIKRSEDLKSARAIVVRGGRVVRAKKVIGVLQPRHAVR